MANLQCSCLLTLITFILLSFGHNAAARTEAFREIHNIMIKPRHDRSLGTALIPRNWDVDSVAAIESPSPLAVVKRILLGRQGSTCDPGYSLCRASQRCCPDTNGNGQCCDDGTCLMEGQTCCTNGGGACDVGLTCCEVGTCAPKGGECCANGESCDAGFHCVIFRGAQRCCENLDCTGGNIGGAVPTLPSFTFTPISVTPLSFTPVSVTPLSFESFTEPSFTVPSITVPSITVPTPVVAPNETVGNDYSYYTTLWTSYYYSYFMTVIRVTLTTPTSTRDSTTVTFSVYATDSADASDQFKSMTGDIPVQSAFTAPGFTNAVVTASSASSSASPVGVGGVGGGSVPTSVSSSSGDSAGAASAAVKSQSSIGVLLAGCGLGLGVGLLAMWL